ncbi:MAG TPA: gephyrin-like molybdotransferase Glp [Solirubrobacterales bacterium]
MTAGALSAAELTEIEDARSAVLERAAPLEAEQVPLGEALGRVLAEDAVSSEPVPGFDNSAMDGFAVRAADTEGAEPDSPVALRDAGESRAGRPASASLRQGEAIRISTGAALPAGADAVVRVEDTRSEDERVLVEVEVEAGHDIRRAGEDIAAGEAVLERGTPIGPAELGVLASLGSPSVPCHRRPRVRVLTTGDELIPPGEEMRPGGVRNSNAYSIPALAERAGGEVLGADPVPDDPDATRKAIGAALDADLVVICGGVSVGGHDHVKGALAELGVEQVFWGVALKPGRPTWFGTRRDTLVFGLPGNPVSAMVTFLLLVRPSLAALNGADTERQRTEARLAEDYEKRPGRAHAVRCSLELREDGWRAHPTGAQGSHILTSMLGADCLAMIPTEAESLRAGDPVQVELIGAV